jgi:hypothetical protein
MPAHAVTLHLPDSLYEYFQQQAEHARRTLEAELLRIVAAAAPVDEMLSPELEEAVERLSLLSDDELWQAARGVLSPEESARLESLHLVQQSTGLSSAEKMELAELLQRYEQAIVIRAEAAQLLHERGHDVSGLIAKR